jgi:hypothetical protein
MTTKSSEGKGIKDIFNRFAGNKNCPKCHGEGSYMYDDIHSKVCEMCCTHPNGFEIPDKRYYDDQTPTCFICGKEQAIKPLSKKKTNMDKGGATTKASKAWQSKHTANVHL